MIKKRKILILIILVLLFLIAILVFYISRREICIVFTSDIHSSIDENNNYQTIKQLKKDYMKNSYTVLIDGGDFTQKDNIENDIERSKIIDLMNESSYDFITLGNHEFDLGINQLSEDLEHANFKIIASNINYIGDGKDVLDMIKSYVIKKYGNIKIAFLGILNPSTLENDGSDIYDIYCDKNDKEDDGARLINRIQEIVNEVRNKADYVVVISHLGSNDSKILSSRDLPIYISGIDIILNAHSHNTINEFITDKDGKEVLLLSVGDSFEQIGIVKIDKNKTIEANFYGN